MALEPGARARATVSLGPGGGLEVPGVEADAALKRGPKWRELEPELELGVGKSGVGWLPGLGTWSLGLVMIAVVGAGKSGC